MKTFEELKQNKNANVPFIREGKRLSEITYSLDLSDRKETTALLWLLPCKFNEPEIYKVYRHYFKGKQTGLVYSENSLTTKNGARDPVSEANTHAFIKGDKETASNRRRIKRYYTNVMVVRDDKQPRFNGRVRVFEFGQQIYDIIQDYYENGDREHGTLFDLFDPVYLRVHAKLRGPYYNYLDSHFVKNGTIQKTDEELEDLFGQTYQLSKLTKFKSYSQLLDRFLEVCPEEAEAGGFFERYYNTV